jgi:hypothetical protein
MPSQSRMAMYRQWQYDQMALSNRAYRQTLSCLSPEQARTIRDGGTGWTTVEVVCHLRDFDSVFQERAELTLRKEFAELPFPNPDRLARERNYNALNLDRALSQWNANRMRMLSVFESVDIEDEDTWRRMGNHPKRGPFTLMDQLMLIPVHDMIHLNQLVKIIEEGS